jgi:hypothetical protein
LDGKEGCAARFFLFSWKQYMWWIFIIEAYWLCWLFYSYQSFSLIHSVFWVLTSCFLSSNNIFFCLSRKLRRVKREFNCFTEPLVCFYNPTCDEYSSFLSLLVKEVVNTHYWNHDIIRKTL